MEKEKSFTDQFSPPVICIAYLGEISYKEPEMGLIIFPSWEA